MNDQIKPCPFCGGEAHANKANRVNWYVFCVKCNISTDGMLINGGLERGGLERHKSEQEAIEHWNTRSLGFHKCFKCGDNTNIPIAEKGEIVVEMCDICYFMQYGVTKQEMQQNIMRRAKAKEDAINKILEVANTNL